MRFQNRNNVRQRNGRGRAGGRGRYRGKGRAAGHHNSEELLAPQRLVPFAHFTHACLEDIVCQVDLVAQVPYFSAPVFLENREHVGKVDEIFGTTQSLCVSLRLLEPLRAKRFAQGHMFFIEPQKLLPLSRFLPRTAANGKTQQKPKSMASGRDVGAVRQQQDQQPPRGRFSSVPFGSGRGGGGGRYAWKKSRKYQNRY